MSKEEFIRQQYITLREEIRESKARIFKLLIVGTVLIPIVAYTAEKFPDAFANACMPFIVLILMFAFVLEQSGIIRAGRYLKEHVEPQIEDFTGWEHWLESHRRLREVDRSFFGTFLLIFLIFYGVATASAVISLQHQALTTYWIGAIGYAIGGIWFVIIVMRHWRFSTTTEA